MRLVILLLGSILFYLWGEPRFVPVVLVSALVDYLIGRVLPPVRGVSRRRLWLVLGVLANLGLLVYFKYFNFFIDNLDLLLLRLNAAPFRFEQVALPIGVSFIVFEKISYLVDLYRGRSEPAKGFATYLAYVFFFPKLAGPILKFHEMADQLKQLPRPDLHGFMRFMRGVVRKVLLADPLANGADPPDAGCPGRGDHRAGDLPAALPARTG